jgi:putative oxidoreductase
LGDFSDEYANCGHEDGAAGAVVKGSGRVKSLWTITIPRLLLAGIFASAAINYFLQVTLGWVLFRTPLTAPAQQFAKSIITAGYLWPFMKLVNLLASLLLLLNRAPALGLLLLLPATVVIVWFQWRLNPLPIPLATTAVVVLCELLLLAAYRRSYCPLLKALH